MPKKLSEAIVNYINTDTEIISKIGFDSVYLLYTTDIYKPSIIYEIKPIIGGIVKQSQLQLKILSDDAELVLELEEKLDKLFDFTIQDPNKILINDISFRSEKSGGGLLFREDLKVYENTLIYIMKWRGK